MQGAPHAVCAHELCAVEQRESFLRPEMNGRPVESFVYFRCRVDHSIKDDCSKSDQRKGKMCERCEVSRSAERSHLEHLRKNVHIVHVHESLHRAQLNAGISVSERLDLEEQHEFYDFIWHRAPRSACV